MKIIAAIFLACCLSASADPTFAPWANFWGQHATSPERGRFYLEVTNSLYNLQPGTNITFQTNGSTLKINSTGGGGGSGTNCFTFTASYPIGLTLSSFLGCTNVQYGINATVFETNGAVTAATNQLWGYTTNYVKGSTNTTSQLWGAVTNLIQGVTSNGLTGAFVKRTGNVMSGPLNIQLGGIKCDGTASNVFQGPVW